jgi:hypothetical protein
MGLHGLLPFYINDYRNGAVRNLVISDKFGIMGIFISIYYVRHDGNITSYDWKTEGFKKNNVRRRNIGRP